MEKWVVLALAGIVLVLMSGCAVRMSVTPIQSEEFVQKTVTNQFFDWMFKGSEETK